MDPVQSAEQRIRDLVNSPRRAHLLRQDSNRWFKLCSSMDAIGDTQLAVRAFLDEPMETRRSDGWSYVIVYGVLQVLYVQQDAARTLAECLGLRFELPEELAAIRDARNASIGHPTNYRRASSTAISRMSLSPDGFQMLVFKSGHRPEFRNVGVRAAAEQQTMVMADLLTRAAEHLVNEELEHRQKFRERPLSGALPHTLGYMLEKIGEGLRDGASIPFALAGIDSVRAALGSFRALLDERGIGGAYEDSVGDVLSSLDFVLERLSGRLNGGLRDWVELDGEVYWYYLHGKLDELRHLAQEIDDDYASDGV
jgi:hypothetical protein